MTLNKEALMLFENNQYDEALHLFEEAVKVERTVQSLNNLAWIYLYEEEDLYRAKMNLEEVMEQKPKSHFPYNMLGEIAIKEKRWIEAKEILMKSLALLPSTEAIHNLAVSHYYVGDFQKAAEGFNKIAKDADVIRWYEVMARIQYKDVPTAKSILNRWNDQSDDYIGAIEAADAYLEMECFEEARFMFEKEWDQYMVSPYIIGRYAYTLFQLGDLHTCLEIINQAIEVKKTEIIEEQQEPCDEHWIVTDKTERVAELQLEKIELDQLFVKIQSGFRPPLGFELESTGGCYLFGCQQPQHLEYI
jgi:tetratricopeptide (TPR) repeat protein